MVSNGLIPITIQNGTTGSGGCGTTTKEMDRCSCCPYGYHIDRDFVPFTKKMLSKEANVDRLRELRSKLRSQRKSMDKLLGVLHQQRSLDSQWEVETLSRATVDVWKTELRRIERSEKHHQQQQKHHHHYESGDEPTTELNNFRAPNNFFEDSSNNDGLESGLQAAVKDFEDALSRTRPVDRHLNYEIPDSQKFHTFPRSVKGPPKDVHLDADVTLLIMREKDSRPSIRDLTNKMESSLISDYVPANRHHHRPTRRNSSPGKDNDENVKGASSEQFTSRIRELEEQVKLIPELQVKVTLLAEEKRQVMKLLENEKIRRARIEQVYEQLKSHNGGQLGDVNQNVVVPATSEKRPTRDAGVGKSVLTRDVGSSPVSPTMREFNIEFPGSAVGESISLERLVPLTRSDSGSPTGSLVGTIRRRIRTFEAGVQVTDLDLGVRTAEPLLQIIEKVDCGTQSLPEEVDLRKIQKESEKVKMKTVGVHAKPRTVEVGVNSKPKCREIGVTASEPKVEKPKTKHVAVTADLWAPAAPVPAVHKASSAAKVATVSIAVGTTLSIPPSDDNKLLEPLDSKLEPLDRKLLEPLDSKPLEPFDNKSLEPLDTKLLEPSAKSSKLEESVKAIASSPSYTISKRLLTPPASAPPAITSHSSSEPRPIPGDTSNSSTLLNSPGSSPPGDKPSRIPRLATPSTSPSGSPKPVIKSAEPLPESLTSARSPSKLIAPRSPVRPPPLKRQNTYTKEIHLGDNKDEVRSQGSESSEDDDPGSKPTTAASEVSTTATIEERERISPTKEMLGALKVLSDALLRGRTTQQVTAAISIILHEWFRVAGTKLADPGSVEDYLDAFESFSPQLLRYIVNMPDGNGNTAMHYAVSHGNFDVVSILLDSKVCDPNKANKAGYTSVMLVSLAKILSETHRGVVRRLFSMGDVNIKAAQHGQTALMLAASHGRLDTVKLLLEAGADINIQDEDGSTALMCASEHGHGEIVKYFLTQSDCDPHITDNDGSTALSIAMEAGHKDIGVMLYAHMHFVSPNPASTSPSSTRAKKSRSETPRSSPNHSSPSFSSQTSPVIAKKQFSTH